MLMITKRFVAAVSNRMKFWVVGLFSFLSILSCTAGLEESRCSGDQITWIYRSGQVIGCSPCPACPPGSEYSIPCGTKALNGTPAICIACPQGKFSVKFDNKPCVACTRCSKRYIKKICTRLKNAVCGGCLAGYYYSKVSFGCEECGRCCKDGKDSAPPGCARVGMCQTRPYGCPNTNSAIKIPISINWTSKYFTKRKEEQLKSRSIPISKGSLKPTMRLYLTKLIEKNVLTSKPTKRLKNGDIPKEKDGDAASLQYLLYGAVGLLLLIAIILLVAGCRVYTKSIKNFQRPVLIRSTSYSTSPFTPHPSPEDRTLEDFVETDQDVVGTVCALLCDRPRRGMWDFERVALRFGLSKEERIAIKNYIYTPGNPTRELLDVLCTKRPHITVKQFAEIVKNIKRDDIYKKLQPFFIKSSP